MHTVIDKKSNFLRFNLPSTADYKSLDQLFTTEFYQYAKSNWNIDDILEGNSLLPANNSDFHKDLEFNYMVNNKNQQFIGYIKGYYPLKNHSLWIQILAVDSPYLRRGYGRLIVKELVLHISEESSIGNIFLTCHNNNISGIDFWESLGFHKIYNIKSTHGLYKADLRSLTCIPNHLKP